MFIPIWLIFFGTGLIMAVTTLAWSVRSHQFDDQDRARFLPLAGLTPGELDDTPTTHRGVNFFAYMAIFGAGLIVFLTCLFIVATH